MAPNRLGRDSRIRLMIPGIVWDPHPYWPYYFNFPIHGVNKHGNAQLYSTPVVTYYRYVRPDWDMIPPRCVHAHHLSTFHWTDGSGDHTLSRRELIDVWEDKVLEYAVFGLDVYTPLVNELARSEWTSRLRHPLRRRATDIMPKLEPIVYQRTELAFVMSEHHQQLFLLELSEEAPEQWGPSPRLSDPVTEADVTPVPCRLPDQQFELPGVPSLEPGALFPDWLLRVSKFLQDYDFPTPSVEFLNYLVEAAEVKDELIAAGKWL